MPTSHSPNRYVTFTSQLPHDPRRLARASIMNGVPISAAVVAQLEAMGVNVGELEQRLRQNMGFVR